MKKVEDIIKAGFRRKGKVDGHYDYYENGDKELLRNPISGRTLKYNLRDN